MYGRKVTTRALLLGKVPAPAAAGPFLAEIRGAKAQAVAEGKTEDKSEARAEAKGNVSVTGCLQRGDGAGEFSIFGEDGKVWGLRSSTVKLEDHVGHKVTVAGTARAESKAEAKKEKKEGEVVKASEKEEYRDLRVTSLNMVSDTCAK
jgi:hypothetical protein